MTKPLISVVSVLQPGAGEIRTLRAAVQDVQARLSGRASELEFLVVGNGLGKDDILGLKRLMDELPDLQAFILAKPVEYDTATLAGIENAIGEAVLTLDPADYDGAALDAMVERAASGADAVLVCSKTRGPGLYGLLRAAFYGITSCFGRAHEGHVTCQRLMRRQTVNFLLQHDHAAHMLRALPLRSGFAVEILWSAKACGRRPARSLHAIIARLMRAFTSDSARPMRLVAAIGVVAGLFNVAYLAYVALIWLFYGAVKGWTTMSFQISGMFFLICFMLALMAEYIVQIHGRAVKRPEYVVSQELHSHEMTREARLNVESGRDESAA